MCMTIVFKTYIPKKTINKFNKHIRCKNAVYIYIIE